MKRRENEFRIAPRAALCALGVVCVFALALVHPLAAEAVPGDVRGVRGLPGLLDTPIHPFGPSHPVTRLKSGGYLALQDTSVRVKSGKKSTVVTEVRKLKLRKYSSGGRIDRRFEKSPIGRGVMLGRKGEYLDLRSVIHYSGDTYLAWAGSDGDNGTRETWPRMIVVAFSAKSGRLIRTFGTKGVMTFGARPKYFWSRGVVTPGDITVLNDGRILACGDLRGVTNAEVRRPYFAVANIDSRSPRPFLTSGKFDAELMPSESGFTTKSCLALTQDASGRVISAGYGRNLRDDSTYTSWVAAFSPNGEPDRSFARDGQQDLDPTSKPLRRSLLVRGVFADAVGRVYVIGESFEGSVDGFIARIRADGEPDPSFADEGFRLTDAFGMTDGWVDGDRIYVAGRSKDSPTVGRVDESGQWDVNFFGRGWRTWKKSYTEDGVFRVSNAPSLQFSGWYYGNESSARARLAVVTVDGRTLLDSRVETARSGGSGTITASGVASSPTGIQRVEVGLGKVSEPPTSWVVATGAHSWRVTIDNSRSISKSARIYSRVVDALGVVEKTPSQQLVR